MKQVSHNMGSTVDEKGARQRTEPFEDFFQFNGSKLLQAPYPDHRPSRLPELLDGLSNSAERPGLDDDTGRAENLERRIAFQEELDWAWYRSFGLLEEQVCCSGFDPPPIGLGERAFEIVLARKVKSGELTTTWFDRHGSTKTTDMPSRWPEAYRQIVKQRIEVIESNSDIALIEQLQYKAAMERRGCERARAATAKGKTARTARSVSWRYGCWPLERRRPTAAVDELRNGRATSKVGSAICRNRRSLSRARRR